MQRRKGTTRIADTTTLTATATFINLASSYFFWGIDERIWLSAFIMQYIEAGMY
ncbi:hypothetical protein KAU88_09800 [Candidatus Bathyarchaeota archaeon]|nr:hypothetical protein [Candidatus Bathyarchaeota archaeon]